MSWKNYLLAGLLFVFCRTVAAAPTIAVSPGVLTFTALEGSNPEPQLLNISNSGNGTLNWIASPETYGTGNWLILTPVSGTNTGKVEVSINIAGLRPGQHYHGQVNISASGVANSPQ